MKSIFIGPPGAGKGTVAAHLMTEFIIPHISTGELFRNALKNETPLGIKVKDFLKSGNLVPDSITLSIVRERLEDSDTENGFILDGFPRTLPQAEALDDVCRIDKVIDFEITDEDVIKRLSGRRVCKSCGATFHILFLPPQTEAICDNCGGELITREDDTIESIKNRLIVYRKETEPVIEYYNLKGLLTKTDASCDSDSVFRAVKKILFQ